MFRLPSTRRLILGGALLVTVVASVWPRSQDKAVPEVVAAVAPRDSSSPERKTAQAPASLPSLATRRERHASPGQVRDLFGPKTWAAPPPRAQPMAPPPPPTAPPFPYVVAGTLMDGNGVIVVFSNRQYSVPVRVGEVLDQTYRIESIDPQSVTLTYLPLGLTQRVPTGTIN